MPPLILRFGRCKDRIVKQQLTENKGQIVDLKTARIPLGSAEGCDAVNERTDAFDYPVIRYLEQHDKPVRRTDAERKEVDSLYPEHVDRRYRRKH